MESRDPHDKGKAKEEEEELDFVDALEPPPAADFFDALEFLPAQDEEPPSGSPSLPPLVSVSMPSSPSPSAAPSLRRRIVTSHFFQARTATASSHQIVDPSSDTRRNILTASESQVIDLGSSSVAPGQHVDRGTVQPETSNLEDPSSDTRRNILTASESQVIDLGSSSVAPGQHVDRGTVQPETSNLEDPSSDTRRNILTASESQVIDLGSSSVAPGQHVDRGTVQPETSNLDRERGVPAVAGRFRRRLGSLVSVVGAVIKVIFYFVALLIRLFLLPIRLFRTAYRIAPKLLHVLRRGRGEVRLRSYRFFKGVFDRVHPWVCGNRIGRKQAWNFLVRLSKGCFWSLYVCIVLSSLVGASSLVAFLIVLKVVDAPIRMTEELNFDYALPRPQALVPITASDSCYKIDDLEVLRLVPPKHKFQLAISLTLPESDYNKNVGVFQVRVELLTSDGNISSSSWRPCALHFKSFHFRLLEMFLKSVSMLAGYSSESQVLKVQMKGLTEGRKPTVCIRVTLEQRTGSRAGAGIPEVYSASMKLESDLPLMKRIIWNWKITLFIWTTMAVFNLQLLALLVFFRPILLPRAARVDLPANPPLSRGDDHPSLPPT